MRRNSRGIYDDGDSYKTVLWIAGGILLIAIISFFVVYGIYNDKVEATKLGSVNEETSKINMSNSSTNSTVVSSSIGKNVNEMKNSVSENVISNTITNNTSNTVANSKDAENNKKSSNTTETKKNVSNKVNDTSTAGGTNGTLTAQEANSTSNTTETSANKNTEAEKENSVAEEKEPVFQNPIENGEIMKEFANENLVYSETLEEWITHLGIDIKAPKTTVVKAAEEGTVESIKNDPRYGLTIIVKHAKDYKTVYSNLLTTEFVAVGDKVQKGQSLGTVGNSAAFEIADEPHLHFEIIKNSEKVNPTLYINF